MVTVDDLLSAQGRGSRTILISGLDEYVRCWTYTSPTLTHAVHRSPTMKCDISLRELAL